MVKFAMCTYCSKPIEFIPGLGWRHLGGTTVCYVTKLATPKKGSIKKG